MTMDQRVASGFGAVGAKIGEVVSELSTVVKSVNSVTPNSSGNVNITMVSGNAGSATKLQTARTISLTGDVSGSVSFDGQKDVSITATVADDSHAHVISNIDGLQTALAETGYSLGKSSDGTKLQLKNKDGAVLSETDAPAAGDSLKGNKLTAALPISEGDIVVYGAHILNIETEEVVEGYMPLKDCHMMAPFSPILGATSNIASGESSENVCQVGKFSIASVQDMTLAVGEPVYVRCIKDSTTITVAGFGAIFDAFKTAYPDDFGNVVYDAPDKLTQSYLGVYPDFEIGFFGKASDYILLGHAVSETEVLLSPSHPVFRHMDGLGLYDYVVSANYDGEGNVISSTYAKKSDVSSIPTATSTTLGGVKIGSNITVSSGTISLLKSNVTSALGYTPVKSVNGTQSDANGNVTITVGSDYTLPKATSTTLGGVTIGSNITVSSGKISLTSSNVTSALGYTPLQTAPVTSVNGQTGAVTISEYSLPKATSTTLGGVKIGSNITVSSGTISLSKSNVTSALGYTPLQTAPVTSVNGQTGAVNLNLGVTSFNGSTGAVTYTAPVTSVNGKTGAVTISEYSLPKATSTTLGGVTIGSNITVSSGQISLTKSNVTSALGYTPVTSVNGQTGDVTIDSVASATKAAQDGYGNTITSTYAKLASPSFTGTPTAPTASSSSNSTQIATTAFVKTALGSVESGIPVSGNRGSLAGYQTVGTDWVFDDGRECDANQITGRVTIRNGTTGTSWTKIIRMTTASSVSMNGDLWRWKDNSVPTITEGGILVLCWCGDGGIATFLSPS